MKIYLLCNGKPYGPYTRQAVENFLVEKRISSDGLACGVGQAQWIALADLLGSLPSTNTFQVNESKETVEEDEGGAVDTIDRRDAFEEDEKQEDTPTKELLEESETIGSHDDLDELDCSETAEKIKVLVSNGEMDFALDLLRGLGEEKTDICVFLLESIGVTYEGELESPDWMDYGENSKMAFLYVMLGMVYNDPRMAHLHNKITKIDLSYSDITDLPKELCQLDCVEELSLQENKLTNLPVEFGGMRKLIKVNFSGNQFKKIPPSLAEAKNLEELDLSGNQFKKKYQIWEDLKDLAQLKGLNLSANSLSPPIEDLSSLSCLESLNLSSIPFKNDKLGPMIKPLGTLPALSNLDLSDCKISKIPDEMLGLEKLKSIDLSRNKLKKVPTKLNQLPELESLQFFGNPVFEDTASEYHDDFPLFDVEEKDEEEREFSDWVEPSPIELTGRARELLNEFEEGFNSDRIEMLDERINSIINEEIPELLLELVRGCRLDGNGYFWTGCHFPFPSWIDSIITSDKIEGDPSEKWKGTPWSEEARSEAALPFYAMIRLMVHLPQDERVHPSLLIKNIKRLCLTLPERIPAEIGYFSELEELVLSRNELLFLPSKIGDLKNLRVLSLDNNKLTELPPALANLSKLRHLGLSNNSIDELPKWIAELSELRILDLSLNRVKELPASIGELTRLQFLGLKSNKLTRLPPEIGQLKNLMHLWLGSNSIEVLPDELYQIESLLAMGLGGNPCIPTNYKWLRGVNLSHRPDKINLMALKADNPKDAKWVLQNVLSWSGS